MLVLFFDGIHTVVIKNANNNTLNAIVKLW